MTRDPMKCLGLMTLSASLLLAGCDDKQSTTQTERPAPEVVQRDTPRDPDPAEHTDPDATADEPAGGTDRDPAPQATDPAPGPGSDPPLADPPTDPAAGRVATINGTSRAPFPEAGESLRTHVAPTRLSDHDAFKNDIEPEDIPDVVPWEEAGEYVGHTITVEGRIVDIGATRDGNINFLNFHADWRGKFYMVIFNDLAETLDGSVEDIFLNKLVRVRGEVEDHRGRPQIKIESMNQVEFVEEDE